MTITPQAISTAQATATEAGLTPASAQHLLECWQAVRSAALAPQHATRLLPQVLTGPALRQALEEADELERANRSFTMASTAVQVCGVGLL